MSLQFSIKQLLTEQPLIMGVINVTPDSFSDGGQFTSIDSVVTQSKNMIAAGAAILDIGGESTRPGADIVTLEQELARVIPVISELAKQVTVPISIDTSKPEVMQAAVAAGASMINDVRALQEPGALAQAAKLNVPVCLMHMQGQPRTMQQTVHYNDVVAEVKEFLLERAAAAMQAGIQREQILLDPGFGFGKSLAHNIALLKQLSELVDCGFPVLVGMSRKSMIGQILGTQAEPVPVAQRLYGSVAAAVIAAMQGVAIIRVHDVQATHDAIQIVRAILV